MKALCNPENATMSYDNTGVLGIFVLRTASLSGPAAPTLTVLKYFVRR